VRSDGIGAPLVPAASRFGECKAGEERDAEERGVASVECRETHQWQSPVIASQLTPHGCCPPLAIAVLIARPWWVSQRTAIHGRPG
jgi:hypothetical protein